MTHLLRLAGIVVGSAAAWVFLMPRVPLSQPIPFAHAKHTGLACSVCHSGVETGARAGIPQAALCLKCHATAPRGAQGAIWEDAVRGRPIAWTRVTRLPDHAMFSHRRHVSLARLDCSSCHGTIGKSEMPPGRAPIRLDMDACLACHRREGASQDCAGCHR